RIVHTRLSGLGTMDSAAHGNGRPASSNPTSGVNRAARIWASAGLVAAVGSSVVGSATPTRITASGSGRAAQPANPTPAARAVAIVAVRIRHRARGAEPDRNDRRV